MIEVRNAYLERLLFVTSCHTVRPSGLTQLFWKSANRIAYLMLAIFSLGSKVLCPFEVRHALKRMLSLSLSTSTSSAESGDSSSTEFWGVARDFSSRMPYTSAVILKLPLISWRQAQLDSISALDFEVPEPFPFIDSIMLLSGCHFGCGGWLIAACFTLDTEDAWTCAGSALSKADSFSRALGFAGFGKACSNWEVTTFPESEDASSSDERGAIAKGSLVAGLLWRRVFVSWILVSGCWTEDPESKVGLRKDQNSKQEVVDHKSEP